jgi:hypothetical protein
MELLHAPLDLEDHAGQHGQRGQQQQQSPTRAAAGGATTAASTPPPPARAAYQVSALGRSGPPSLTLFAAVAAIPAWVGFTVAQSALAIQRHCAPTHLPTAAAFLHTRR